MMPCSSIHLSVHPSHRKYVLNAYSQGSPEFKGSRNLNPASALNLRFLRCATSSLLEAMGDLESQPPCFAANGTPHPGVNR